MFHKNIVELQKIRKFVDYRKIDLAEQPLLSQKLDDISFQITILIKDLVQCDKIIKDTQCITEEDTMR